MDPNDTQTQTPVATDDVGGQPVVDEPVTPTAPPEPTTPVEEVPAETPAPVGEAPTAPTYEEPAAAEPPVAPAEGEETPGAADEGSQPV